MRGGTRSRYLHFFKPSSLVEEMGIWVWIRLQSYRCLVFFVISIRARYSIFTKLSLGENTDLALVTLRSWWMVQLWIPVCGKVAWMPASHPVELSVQVMKISSGRSSRFCRNL